MLAYLVHELGSYQCPIPEHSHQNEHTQPADYLCQQRGHIQGSLTSPIAGRTFTTIGSCIHACTHAMFVYAHITYMHRHTYLCLVCHNEGELCIHRCVPNKVTGFDGILLNEVSLSMCNESPKKHSQWFRRSVVRVFPIVL